jgi:hypothetical protein
MYGLAIQEFGEDLVQRAQQNRRHDLSAGKTYGTSGVEAERHLDKRQI